MSTPTEQIASQNEEYRRSLLNDIKTRNNRVIELMNATAKLQEEDLASERLKAMNSFTPTQRRRLMGGEKLEDILGDKFKPSKYYNTSNEGAGAIPKDVLFEYQIGDHLMAFETNEITINHELKTIDLPVVVYDPETQEYRDALYTIDDTDIFDILVAQQNPGLGSVAPFEAASEIPLNTSSEFTHYSPPIGFQDEVEIPFNYEVTDEDIPDWVQEDYNNRTFAKHSEPKVQKRNDTDQGVNKSVKKIQDKLFEQLLSIYQGESIYSNQVYTQHTQERIEEMLRDGYFPFQIVNNLIEDFAL